MQVLRLQKYESVDLAEDRTRDLFGSQLYCERNVIAATPLNHNVLSTANILSDKASHLSSQYCCWTLLEGLRYRWSTVITSYMQARTYRGVMDFPPVYLNENIKYKK